MVIGGTPRSRMKNKMHVAMLDENEMARNPAVATLAEATDANGRDQNGK